ncbi:MAG: metal-dependent hydrolase [Candidatus Bathyarchaeota archaeon]|nr:metal-dependent hydrolase [Candidatus Bathyarchaeota archaeon]
MNIVFHVLIGLLFSKLYGISSLPGISMGVLFSVFPDLDHVPHLKRALETGRFGVGSRSSLHELVGLAFILSGSLLVGIAYPHLLPLTFSCGLSHFVVDLLTRPIRPLYPFSTWMVDLKLYPRGLREMILWDAVLTLGLGLIYVMTP